MHKILEDQIKNHISPSGPFPEGWKEFLAAVSETYTMFDQDANNELEKGEAPSKDQEKMIARQDELERLNSLMIGRELKMVELKQMIELLKKENAELRKSDTSSSVGTVTSE